MEKDTFIRLVAKYVEGNADPAEEELLEAYFWRMEEKGETVLTRKEEEELRSRLLWGIREKTGRRALTTKLLSSKGRLVAAAVLVFAVAGAGFWLDAAKKRPVNDVAPGGNKALLTLADGTKMALDKEGNGLLKETGNARIIKQDGDELSYLPKNIDDHTHTVFNRLSVPRGGQYKLTLPDGTRIWLNAASSVRYPTTFTGAFREVELTGEAYFEVTKNEAKPFLVRVPGDVETDPIEVMVLGTHFNINAYRNEQAVKTTLLEGSVQLRKGREQVLLRPGEQALVTNGNVELTEIRIARNINTDGVIAWKNGWFQFNDTDMKSIMMQLERWYDVKVDYDHIPRLHFSGTISKDRYLSEVLHMLELTSNLTFELIDGQITVKLR